MARQTVGAISSREFTVSPTGCRNPLTEQRKLSRSPLLIRLRPSSLKFGMISPGLYLGSPLLITWQQSFAYGRRIKQGFVEFSLQLLHPECSDKTGISLLSKRRHWKSSDTFWMFNIYITTRDVSGPADRLWLQRQFQLSLRLLKSFQTLRQILEQVHDK